MIATKRRKNHKKEYFKKSFCVFCAFLWLFPFLFASNLAIRMLQLRREFLNQIVI